MYGYSAKKFPVSKILVPIREVILWSTAQPTINYKIPWHLIE